MSFGYPHYNDRIKKAPCSQCGRLIEQDESFKGQLCIVCFEIQCDEQGRVERAASREFIDGNADRHGVDQRDIDEWNRGR